jgi:hypothetical protein
MPSKGLLIGCRIWDGDHMSTEKFFIKVTVSF